eukprot:11204792-Alexandrium_andersonii.AAC.1
MSASLVGSEMCIRDRYHPALCTAILRGIAALRAREGRHLLAPLVRRLEPVSYTHLTLPTICSV